MADYQSLAPSFAGRERRGFKWDEEDMGEMGVWGDLENVQSVDETTHFKINLQT